MTIRKYVPETIGQLTPRGWHKKVPVLAVMAYQPGRHPTFSPIVKTMWAVEVQTVHGSRCFGAQNAFIDSNLKMVVELADESGDFLSIKDWPDAK
jgi:hypothetical protein